MSKKSVFCLVGSRNEADQIVERLKKANFSNNEVAVLFPAGGKNPEFVEMNNKAVADASVTRAGTGAVVGGALGWIAGIATLAIPGVGPFLAAGPILAALSSAAIGATAGGIAGGLIGMGIPEADAKRYEGRVKTGNVLISVHTDDPGDLARARDIFRQTGAQDICTAGEAYAKGAPAAVSGIPGYR